MTQSLQESKGSVSGIWYLVTPSLSPASPELCRGILSRVKCLVKMFFKSMTLHLYCTKHIPFFTLMEYLRNELS